MDYSQYCYIDLSTVLVMNQEFGIKMVKWVRFLRKKHYLNEFDLQTPIKGQGRASTKRLLTVRRGKTFKYDKRFQISCKCLTRQWM